MFLVSKASGKSTRHLTHLHALAPVSFRSRYSHPAVLFLSPVHRTANESPPNSGAGIGYRALHDGWLLEVIRGRNFVVQRHCSGLDVAGEVVGPTPSLLQRMAPQLRWWHLALPAIRDLVVLLYLLLEAQCLSSQRPVCILALFQFALLFLLCADQFLRNLIAC